MDSADEVEEAVSLSDSERDEKTKKVVSLLGKLKPAKLSELARARKQKRIFFVSFMFENASFCVGCEERPGFQAKICENLW